MRYTGIARAAMRAGEIVHPEVAAMRISYDQGELLESTVSKCPFEQFESWFLQAKKDLPPPDFEVNAMHLSTATKEGKPSGRIVLLKDYSKDGFVFYTNYLSRKGRELKENPQAALSFYWSHQRCVRTVRIEGIVEKVPQSESDEYFSTRPRGSQIGALISEKQSSIIQDRSVLEKREQFVQETYGEDKPIPRPEYWGGYIVKPTSFEFWQGRPSRLHDRIEFVKEHDNWTIRRLSP